MELLNDIERYTKKLKINYQTIYECNKIEEVDNNTTSSSNNNNTTTTNTTTNNNNNITSTISHKIHTFISSKLQLSFTYLSIIELKKSIKQINSFKVVGNSLYSEKKYEEAANYYYQSIQFIVQTIHDYNSIVKGVSFNDDNNSNENNENEEKLKREVLKSELINLLVISFNNYAASKYAVLDYLEAWSYCLYALSIDEKSVKALSRIGEIKTDLKLYKSALDDFYKCISIINNNASDINEKIELLPMSSAKLKMRKCLEITKLNQYKDDYINCSLFLNLKKPIKNIMICSKIAANINEKGRCLIATKDINYGDKLIEETVYSCSNPKSNLCEFCLTDLNDCKLIACPFCNAKYCSLSCQNSAWIYHSLECQFVNILNFLPNIFRLGLRSWLQYCFSKGYISTKNNPLSSIFIINPTVIQVITPDYSLFNITDIKCRHFENINSNPEFKNLHDLIFNLDCHVEDIRTKNIPLFKEYVNSVHLIISMSKINNVLKFHLDENILKQYLLHFILQSHTNTHIVSKKTKYESEVQEKIAGLLYTTSLLNHSCDPNSVVYFKERNAITIALKDIKAGEEITQSYGTEFGKMDIVQRKDILQKQYYFDCNCSKCSIGYEDEYKCQKCNFAIHTMDGICSNNKCKFSHSHLFLKDINAKEEKILSLRPENENTLQTLLEILKIQKEIYIASHYNIARTEDRIASTYASQGDYINAAKYIESSISRIELLFDPNSLEIARERVLLAKCLLNCDQPGKAKQQWLLALNVLSKLGFSQEDKNSLKDLDFLTNY